MMKLFYSSIQPPKISFRIPRGNYGKFNLGYKKDNKNMNNLKKNAEVATFGYVLPLVMFFHFSYFFVFFFSFHIQIQLTN